VFKDLRQLDSLFLRRNAIAFIEPKVFDEQANLPSLSAIGFSYNHITELEPWPIIRAQQRRVFVELARNRITNFTNVLQWSYNCNSTKVFESTVDLSDNDIKHITDVVDGWNIDGRLLI